MTLLYLLANNKLTSLKLSKPEQQLIVAHVNHGIRPDSDKTENLTERLANQYNLPFVSKKLKLKGFSEAEARDGRYRALFNLAKESGAVSIITAHNLNDKIETAIINYIRGTGWRGYCSLNSNQKIIRPLLNLSRTDISRIAGENNLTWHEDSTNSDEAYLRNYIRKNIVPKIDDQQLQTLSLIIDRLQNLKLSIDDIFDGLISEDEGTYSLRRSQITVPGFSEAMLRELLIYLLPKLGATYDKKVVEALADFCLSAVSGKQFLQAGKSVKIWCERDEKDYRLLFQKIST